MLSTVVELYGTGGIKSRVFFYFLDPLKKAWHHRCTQQIRRRLIYTKYIPSFYEVSSISLSSSASVIVVVVDMCSLVVWLDYFTVVCERHKRSSYGYVLVVCVCAFLCVLLC